MLKQAYQNGVPMGGDLPAMTSAAKAPSFIVWELKDPESGNLDRVQIVKGWYAGGYCWERVYVVAWSDLRKRAEATGEKIKIVGTDGVNISINYLQVPEGKLPPVGIQSM